MADIGIEPSKGDGGSISPAAPSVSAKKADTRPAGAAAKPKTGKQADGGAADAAGGPLMTVIVRNEFYRDSFRKMMGVAVLEAVTILALLITLVSYINGAKSQDHYFATTADGRIMQLVPLELPNMGTSALLSWAAQAGSEVMTFGFHDYQRRLQYSSRFFTRHGWDTFTAALQQSRVIESVETLQQVVSAQPRSAPILTQEGMFNGKYRWVVDLPLTVKYQSGQNSRIDNLVVKLVIDRVPSLENPNGVGIEQWVATTNTTN